MNIRSAVISTVALVLLFISALFPPVCDTSNDIYRAYGKFEQRGIVVFSPRGAPTTGDGDTYAQIDFPKLVAEWVRILSLAGIALILANVRGSKGEQVVPPNGP